jgi:hypothetical protein
LAEFVELSIEQGASFNTDVSVSDANGLAKDLTNYSVFSQLRKSYYSNNSFEFTITMVDPVSGQIEMDMSAEVTSNIHPGRYVYDVIIKENTTGEVTRIFEGIATILPRVTKINIA